MKRTFLLAVLCAFATACSSGTGENNGDPPANNTQNNDDGKGDQTGGVTMCAAVRGNGQLIPAHFASLARIVEHYGPIHAVSGGSSGSITSFLLSSIQSNPLVTECNGEPCTTAEESARIALMLKSFQGYLEYLTTTEEAMALQAAAPIVEQVREQGIAEALSDDPSAAVETLLGILEQDELVDVVNPEIIELLRNSPDPEYHARDIVASIEGFGEFSADDPTILVRPGLLNFGELADRIAMVASFYAAYGVADQDAMEAWLNDCAEPGRSKTWSAVRALPAGKSTCGEQFVELLAQYDDVFLTDPGARTRVHDNVGTFMPALISTSVLTGDAVSAWEAARQQYLDADQPTLDVDFDDVRFGYWGSSEAVEMLTEKTNERTDLKSQKALSLRTATWREVLSYSPAEPGLSRALHITDETVSAGGWSDLHPVLVLKDIGCDKVVYVTRTDPESNFALGVAGLLGMDADDRDALYDLSDEESSFSQSIEAADAVWCTNWNDIEATDIEAVVTDAYGARMFTDDAFFTDGERAYENITTEPGVEGCSR
jgi:hypothetical protein